MLVRRALVRAGVQQQLLLRAAFEQRTENKRALLQQQKAGLRVNGMTSRRARNIAKLGFNGGSVHTAAASIPPTFLSTHQLPATTGISAASAARQLPLSSRGAQKGRY
jgi:hypothetical protein